MPLRFIIVIYMVCTLCLIICEITVVHTFLLRWITTRDITKAYIVTTLLVGVASMVYQETISGQYYVFNKACNMECNPTAPNASLSTVTWY
jgi:hypothetical protein